MKHLSVQDRRHRYLRIQNEVIARYRVIICENSSCRSRMHVHMKTRTVCKWRPRNSAEATFDLLHEIGHLEANRPGMRRAEEEYSATVWALERCAEYGIEISLRTWNRYQQYIFMERDRGIRRGGRGFGDLNLPIDAIRD